MTEPDPYVVQVNVARYKNNVQETEVFTLTSPIPLKIDIQQAGNGGTTCLVVLTKDGKKLAIFSEWDSAQVLES